MPDACTITTHPSTSVIVSPNINTMKTAQVVKDMTSSIKQESASLNISAPSSSTQDTPSCPPPPVTFRSTATQCKPPHNASEFFQLHGYEPKMHDLEHKVGLAAIGRYKRPDDVPYGVIHGATFEAAQGQRKPEYVDSCFQIMDLKARNMALAKAKAKAKITANKYSTIVADAGFSIWAETKDERIVHSEQQPFIIKLDKDGNAQTDEDLTGRFLWNIFKDDIEDEDLHLGAAPATGANHPPQSTRPPTPEPLAVQPLQSSLLHTPGNAPPRSIAALNPSLRDDPSIVEAQDESDRTESEDEYEVEQPYAEHSDAYVIVDAEYHLPYESVTEGFSTSKQSCKRRNSSQPSDERDRKRSKMTQALPMNTPQIVDKNASTASNGARAKSLERRPSLTLYTPRGPSTKDEPLREPRDTHDSPLATIQIHEIGHYGLRQGPSSHLQVAPRELHRQSGARDSEPVRQNYGRSRFSAHSDTEVAESSTWRDRGADLRHATLIRGLEEADDERSRLQAAKAAPLCPAQQCDDDTNLEESRTSSSTPTSASTVATSKGSSKSLPTAEPHDEQRALDTSSTFNSAITHSITTGSPMPCQRIRREDRKRIMPRIQRDLKIQDRCDHTDKDMITEHERITELHPQEERHVSKTQAGLSQQSRKRSRSDSTKNLSEIFEDQQRSKRRTKQRAAHSTQEAKYEEALATDSKQQSTAMSEQTTRTNPDVASAVASVIQDACTSTVDTMKNQEMKIDHPDPKVKTKEVAPEKKTKKAEIKKEMTAVQKKIAARKAKRAAQPECARYLSPARRTNAAGNAPTPNQNRMTNNRASRR